MLTEIYLARLIIERGHFLAVNKPSGTVSGTEFSALEMRNSLHLRYARSPPDLPKHCDGCGSKFSIEHALQCKKGGLVNLRHNEIRDELCDIAARAIIPSAVRDEPSINQCRSAVEDENAVNSQTPNHLESNCDRGDVLIHGLWSSGTVCIIDVRVTDTNDASYIRSDPKEVLARHEKEKKNKYLKACLDQRRHFSPFAVSCDGLLRKKAQSIFRNMASRMSKKIKKWQVLFRILWLHASTNEYSNCPCHSPLYPWIGHTNESHELSSPMGRWGQTWPFPTVGWKMH